MRTKVISSLKLIVFALFISIWFTSGYAIKKTVITPQNKMGKQFTLNLPTFSAINVVGPLQISLLDHQQQQTITVMAPIDIAPFINASVQNNTLLLETHFPSNYKNLPIPIKINMRPLLTDLTVRGVASVSGRIVGNPGLSILLTNSGNILLKGKDIPLHSVENDSQNDITIQGIRSKDLLVRGSGEGGKIDLSGQTDLLNAQIKKAMTLYSQTLFARKIYITAQDNALAFVCPVDALYGFAYGNSNIYYYHNNPRNIVRDTYVSGNVLKMPRY
jgi:hypothetical protein